MEKMSDDIASAVSIDDKELIASGVLILSLDKTGRVELRSGDEHLSFVFKATREPETMVAYEKIDSRTLGITYNSPTSSSRLGWPERTLGSFCERQLYGAFVFEITFTGTACISYNFYLGA